MVMNASPFRCALCKRERNCTSSQAAYGKVVYEYTCTYPKNQKKTKMQPRAGQVSRKLFTFLKKQVNALTLHTSEFRLPLHCFIILKLWLLSLSISK